MLSLLTNTGTLKDNINLKEDNKELHSIVSYMLNEYPVEYNKKEVFWKDLSMITKKKLLSKKVKVIKQKSQTKSILIIKNKKAGKV